MEKRDKEEDPLSLASTESQEGYDDDRDLLVDFRNTRKQVAEGDCSRREHFVVAGLRNLGNSCYMNAVLQCLTYTAPLVDYFQKALHIIPCEKEGFCAFCALKRHINAAFSSSGRTLEADELFDNLSGLSSCATFKKYQQEDAHEYMHCLLESVHRSLLPSKASRESLLQGENFVENLFGGRLRSQIRCSNCSRSSEVFEPMIDLSLEIDGFDSIIEALQSFTAEEIIECDGTRQCEDCKQNASVKKQLTIDAAPDVLVIQLKRFTTDGMTESKSTKEISYPHLLDLKPFTNCIYDSESQELEYELYGVLVHDGWSMYSGHYYSMVQTSSGTWHRLDDSEVTTVDPETVLQQEAYILFYFRRGASWFPLLNETISKVAKAESPKSVLNSCSISDESDTSDKECQRTPPGQKPSDKKRKHDILDCSNPASISSSQAKQDATSDPLPNLDMPSVSSSPSLPGAKRCKANHSFSPSTPTAENHSSENGTDSAFQEQPLKKRVSGVFKQTGENSSGQSRSTSILAKSEERGDTEPLRSKNKNNLEIFTSPKANVASSTPTSINKVLSGMPSSRRARLLQYVTQPNDRLQTPEKTFAPLNRKGKENSSHSKNKRTSLASENVETKRQKRAVKPASQKTDISESGSPSTPEHGDVSLTLDDDPYSFVSESEQIPKFYSNKRSNVKNTLGKKS